MGEKRRRGISKSRTVDENNVFQSFLLIYFCFAVLPPVSESIRRGIRDETRRKERSMLT